MKLDRFKVFRKKDEDIAKCMPIMKYAMSYLMDDEHIYRIDIKLETLVVDCTDIQLSISHKSGAKTNSCNQGKCMNSDDLRVIELADTIHSIVIADFFKPELTEMFRKKNPGYNPPDLEEL
jgi:hypothetical protein